MEITKSRLKQIIKEEMDRMSYEEPEEEYEEFSSVEGQDPELDYEGFMTKSQLFRTAECSMELHDMISDEENLPEWMQAKITEAAKSIQDVYNAYKYDKMRGTV